MGAIMVRWKSSPSLFSILIGRRVVFRVNQLKCNETATTIANYLMQTLTKNNLASKCVAFTGDNCNTNFGGTRRDEGVNNVFAHLKRLLQNKTLIGVGCPAHILNNCVHHGADMLNVDIENIIFKIYQYFHIHCAHRVPQRVLRFCGCGIQEDAVTQQDQVALSIPRNREDAADVTCSKSILFIPRKATCDDQGFFWKPF